MKGIWTRKSLFVENIMRIHSKPCLAENSTDLEDCLEKGRGISVLKSKSKYRDKRQSLACLYFPFCPHKISISQSWPLTSLLGGIPLSPSLWLSCIHSKNNCTLEGMIHNYPAWISPFQFYYGAFAGIRIWYIADLDGHDSFRLFQGISWLLSQAFLSGG